MSLPIDFLCLSHSKLFIETVLNTTVVSDPLEWDIAAVLSTGAMKSMACASTNTYKQQRGCNACMKSQGPIKPLRVRPLKYLKYLIKKLK